MQAFFFHYGTVQATTFSLRNGSGEVIRPKNYPSKKSDNTTALGC